MAPSEVTGFNVAAHAHRAAAAASKRGGLRIGGAEDMFALREVCGLFADVWGRNPEGVPMPTEVLRSLVHAGGLVSAAYDAGSGDLLGAAVLGRDVPGHAYSYIAAARAGSGDRGIGFALKQHQRAWCLAADVRSIRWTFDPLVSRNAHFNLSKLGARVGSYEEEFYAQMEDDLNGVDPADRLVAEWILDAPSAVAAAEGTLVDVPDPADSATVLAHGPDDVPAWVAVGDERWCRVPQDVVALRRRDPAAASRWRVLVREWLTTAFDAGLVAVGANRNGWYHLVRPSERSPQ